MPTVVMTATAAGNVIANALTESNISFTPIYQEIVSLIPVLVPVIISVLAIKKGLGFFLGSLRSL